MGNELDEKIKALIKEKTGQTVLIESAECLKREKMLGSDSCCKGCPSEFPCSKIVGADLLVMRVLDKQKGSAEYFTSRLDRIVGAKTSQELKNIIKEFSIS